METVVTADKPDTRDISLSFYKGDTIDMTDGVIYREPPSNYYDDGKTYRIHYDIVNDLGTYSKEPARSIEPYERHSTPKKENIGTKTPKHEYPIVKDYIPSVETPPSLINETSRDNEARTNPRVEEVSSHQLPRRHNLFDDFMRNYNKRLDKRKEEFARMRAAKEESKKNPPSINDNNKSTLNPPSSHPADNGAITHQPIVLDEGVHRPPLPWRVAAELPSPIVVNRQDIGVNASINGSDTDNPWDRFVRDNRWDNTNDKRNYFGRKHGIYDTLVTSARANIHYLREMNARNEALRRYRQKKRHNKKYKKRK